MVPSSGQGGNCSARDVLGQCPLLSVALYCFSPQGGAAVLSVVYSQFSMKKT